MLCQYLDQNNYVHKRTPFMPSCKHISKTSMHKRTHFTCKTIKKLTMWSIVLPLYAIQMDTQKNTPSIIHRFLELDRNMRCKHHQTNEHHV